jgi:hypothetical protein
MGSDVAEAQTGDPSDAELSVLLEVYEVLRLTPANGRKLTLVLFACDRTCSRLMTAPAIRRG